MTPLFGWAERGKRLIDFVPHGHWKTTTSLAALRHEGLTAPMVVVGAINGELFLAYVEQILLPTLGEGDIVVMDNLSSHKVAGVKKAIESVGAQAKVTQGLGTMAKTRRTVRCLPTGRVQKLPPTRRIQKCNSKTNVNTL